MPISIDKLEPGDVLYRVRREKAGNTTMSRTVIDRLTVKAIEPRERRCGIVRCVVTINGKEILEHDLGRWRRSPPEWVYVLMEGRQCVVCRARKEDGHTALCTHPAAMRARRKAGG